MEDALIKCSSCGKELPLDAVFCTNCGKRLEEEKKHTKAAMAKCSSCGAELPMEAAFCANCGKPLHASEVKGESEKSPVGTQLLALANDFLSVKEVRPGHFEFSSQTGAQSPVQKAKITYDAIAHLEPEKKQVTFWEKMVESSSGSNAGFFSEKTIQKGTEVTQTVHRNLLFGGKYGFEYGKLRQVVKAIAGEQGWKFKLAIFKPKG